MIIKKSTVLADFFKEVVTAEEICQCSFGELFWQNKQNGKKKVEYVYTSFKNVIN